MKKILKLKNKNIILNLPKSLSDSSFYTSEPFIIFSQENFIENDIYPKFSADLDNFMKTIELKKKNKLFKKKFKVDQFTDSFFRKNIYVRDFVEIIYSKRFINWFIETHIPFYGQGIFGTCFPVSNTSKFLLKTLNYIGKKIFKKKFFSIYSISVEFSDLEYGASINPHTDSFHKRMALVLYVPPPSIQLDNEKKKSWGTIFWRAKKKDTEIRSWKSNTQNESDLVSFEENYEVAKKMVYTENSVNGFIKNDVSWHSVEKNKFSSPRRAIVVNFYEQNSTIDDIEQMNLKQEEAKAQV